MTRAAQAIYQRQGEHPELSNLVPQELPSSEQKYELQGGENVNERNRSQSG